MSRRLPSGIEAIARAANCNEVTRLLGVYLEPLSQLPDEVVDGSDRASGLVPHQVEELGAREDLGRVGDEEDEQLELEVRELDVVTGAGDRALGRDDLDVAERELIGGRGCDGRGGDVVRAAEDRVDAGEMDGLIAAS